MKRFLFSLLAVLVFSTNACAYSKGQSIEFLLSQVRTSTTSLIGGKVYFYAAGGTTPQTVWTDRSKTTAAANPYTLDANATAQLYGDGVYRIVIKDAAGVTRFDRDNLAYHDITVTGVTTNASEYADLPTAVAAIGSTVTTLEISNAQTLSASLTIPSNITLKFTSPGTVSVASGKTLIVNGPMSAELRQIFSGSGTVELNTVTEIYPEWFGALGDGNNDTSAIEKAAAAGLSLIISSDSVVDDLTFPETLTVQFRPGGKLTINDYQTLTIYGALIAPNMQIFSGDGDIVFGPKSVSEVLVDWWGAKCDFDPETGDGTDDRAAIQKTVDSLIASAPGIAMKFSGGRCYLGTGYTDDTIVTQLIFGPVVELEETTGAGLTDTIIDFNGASLYQGNIGRALGIFGATNVTLKNPVIYGYTGGTLGSSRENDACITINYNSRNVTIQNAYLTNSLGDAIYIGGSLWNGGETGYTCQDIKIVNSTLKSRYGDGTASYSGGTKGRNALSVIDANGVILSNNTIYGFIDLEPNLDNQYNANILISGNNFKSGYVTAQSSVGSAYWYDEPINQSGGAVLQQGVAATTAAPGGASIHSNVKVVNNTFEYAGFSVTGDPAQMVLENNKILAGVMRVSNPSPASSVGYTTIKNNIFYGLFSGYSACINVEGLVDHSDIMGNYCIAPSGYAVLFNTATAENGYNNIINNRNMSDTAIKSVGFIEGGPSQYSIYSNNTIPQTSFITAVTPTDGVVNYGTVMSDRWQLKGSLAQVTNIPNNTILIIFGDASPHTISHNENIYLKDGVNVDLTTGQAITFYANGNVLVEISRNF